MRLRAVAAGGMLLAALAGAPGASAAPPANRELVVLTSAHKVFATIRPHRVRAGTVLGRRPITRVPTVLPVVRHAVTPLLEGTGKLHGGRVPQSCTDLQDYFRDVIDHLSRINASIDAIRDTIGTAMQVTLSMVTIDEGEVTKRLAARNIQLEFSPESKTLLIEKGYDEKYGARPLRRAVEHYLEDPLAEALLRGEVKEGEPILVVRNGDKLEFRSQSPAAESGVSQ